MAGLALCAALASCRGLPDPALTELIEARSVAAELHVQFIKAADASDRAVLADTDEASVTFAKQAESAVDSVQSGLGELGGLIQRLGYREESQQLDELSKRFAEYRKVDKEILVLAVENTNLKAQRLAFGPVSEAADAMQGALDGVKKGAPAGVRSRVDMLAMTALLAVRETQVLQAPHIAEADDAAMNRLEKEMGQRGKVAREALDEISKVSGPGGRAPLTDAFERFEKLSADLVALSRRNSNVKSLALALRQKPALTAACDTSLVSIEATLAKRGFGATR